MTGFHRGLHRHRLPQNPLEKAFADEWERKNEATGVLQYLLGQNNEPGEVSQRDAKVAATVIQWLGSPVGERFVKDVIGIR